MVTLRQKRALRAWVRFFQAFFRYRLSLDKFDRLVSLLAWRHPLPPAAVADLLMRPQPLFRYTYDSVMPHFIQTLLARDIVDLYAVLAALYRYSTVHEHARAPAHARTKTPRKNALVKGEGIDKKPGEGEKQMEEQGEGGREKDDDDADELQWKNSYPFEQWLFYRLAREVRAGPAIQDGRDALKAVDLMIKWLDVFAVAAARCRDPAAIDDVARQEMESSRAAFVAILIPVCEHPVTLKTLGRAGAKRIRRRLDRSLGQFIPVLAGPAMTQMANRLGVFRTQTLVELDPDEMQRRKEVEELLDGAAWLEGYEIPDLPVQNSRAGLYIYLNAALVVGRPLVDDHALFTYLHNRNGADVQATCVGLIVASFDVLANAVFRAETHKGGHVLRSYLINKVPLLLARLAPSLYAAGATPELCITQALAEVDANAFPTASSSMLDDTRNGGNPFTDWVREDFCLSCCLHGLVSQSRIESILGEIPYQTLPQAGRYTKEGLVRECLADLNRAQALVGELESMDGNVGAVSQALTELLGRMATDRETVSLKTLCSQLVRKPALFDVILLFERPAAVLHPLCELLDNWRYDEEDDQGAECQPMYEEFGSVLLLVLTFVCRYDLTAWDLGLRRAEDRRDSFMARLLRECHLPRPLEKLTVQQNGHLGRWIQGLFDSDGGGLGDEVMSACPPQEFYLLVPTLFHQIVLGVGTGAIGEENLRSGIEYLVETFLLPSLITAIRFLSDRLWVDHPIEQKAILRILQLILIPNSISPEAAAPLASVTAAIAKPLEHALCSHQRRFPKSQEVEPLRKALQRGDSSCGTGTGGGVGRSSSGSSGSSGGDGGGAGSRGNGGGGHGGGGNGGGGANGGAGAVACGPPCRTGAADVKELESWTSGTPGGLTTCLRQTIQSLVQWSMISAGTGTGTGQGINAIPTSYNHGQLLVTRRVLGARRMLQVLVEETRAHSGSLTTTPESTGIMYDVVTGLVCAPNAIGGGDGDGAEVETDNPDHRLSLRELLRLEASECRHVHLTDPAMAETVVRLHRRVEAQMAPAPATVPVSAAAVSTAAVLGEDDSAAAALALEMGMAVGADGVMLDMGGSLPAPRGGGPGSGRGSVASGGDADIFAGLGSLDGWEGMDMEMD